MTDRHKQGHMPPVPPAPTAMPQSAEAPVEVPQPAVPPAAQTPFLSVMLPVYNGEAYIADAIESVLGQPCQDLELIILDDGSTDATLRIAQDYQKQDPRIVIDSHPNMGLGKNRNAGFAHVRGSWLIFLDHDDIILPGFYCNKMRAALASLEEHGIEVVVPARLYANERLTCAYMERVALQGVYAGHSEASLQLPYEFATMLYSTALLKREGLRFSETRPEMESIFRHKAVFCAKNVLFDNNVWFAVRRDNPQQITKNWDWPQVAKVRAEEYKKLCAWHEARGTEGAVLDEVRNRAQAAQDEYERVRQAKQPSAIRKALDRRRAKKDHQRWVEGMQPIQDYEIVTTGNDGAQQNVKMMQSRMESMLDSMKQAIDAIDKQAH